jgi:predicted nucleic acid-binding protein
MLLVDASVWVAATDRDDRYYASAHDLVRGATSHRLAALDLTLYEVANGVMRRFRRADPQAGPAAIADVVHMVLLACAGRPLPVDIDLLASAAQLAFEHDLTVYDAAYVAAARHHGWTLVSIDIADLVSRDLAVTPDSILDL